MHESDSYDRYFLSYSGAGLPLNLVSPLPAEEIANRNTYFGASLDAEGRVTRVHKRVYGEVELAHYYTYDADGRLQCAEIHGPDDEARRLTFDTNGNIVDDEEFDLS